MKKRIFSFIMAMIMVFTMLPVEAIAVTTDDAGNTVYEIGATVWVREDAEPTGTTVEKAFWIPVYDENDQPVTRLGLCGKAEHTHSYVCDADCALAHTHSEECYSDVSVGCTIHQHGGECTTETVYSCGQVEHSHENCTASEICTLEEHDHEALGCGTEVRFTCEDSEHEHSVEAGCTYENVFTCGKEAHTHGDDSCVMETVWDCGQTAHTHTEECGIETRYVGCVEHLAHDESCVTERQLTCGKDEHTCVTEGCAADCALEEHTHTEACDMEGVYYQWMVVEDTSSDFDVDSAAITVPASGYYTIHNAESGFSQTVAAVSGGSRPNYTYTVTFTNVPDGTYVISSGKVNGGGGKGSAYQGTVTVNEDSITAKMDDETTSYNRMNSAEIWAYATSIYYSSSSFNHAHVRSAGSVVIEVGGAQRTATISNPSIVIKENGNVISSKSWEGTTTYEWTNSVRVSRSSLIEVILTVDLTYTDSNGKTVVLEDVVVTYDNVNTLDKFIEAIAICDACQGLDFVVSTQDIQEALDYYTVTYQWKVYNTDGTFTELPAGAPNEPGPDSGIQEDTDYAYDTEYTKGDSFADYNAGLLYTFHGWNTWSHSSTFNVDPSNEGYNAFEDSTIPITADTYIYGFWTATELEPEDAHIAIAKNIVGLENDTEALAQAEKLWFWINPGYDMDKDGVSRVDVGYNMIKAADGEYKLPVYQYDIPFIFTEYSADVPGYDRKVEVAVEENSNLTLESQSGDTATVKISPEYEPAEQSYHLGTVTYTNTYTKKIGEAVSVFPVLTIWKTDYVPTSLAEAEFTLYRDAACETPVLTVSTDAYGYATINFATVTPTAEKFYLKETVAPEGYVLDDTVYEITLTAGAPVEELRNGEFVEVTYYTLKVEVPEDGNAVFSTTASQSLETSTDSYRLHVYNEPILGRLELSKAVEGLAGADKDGLSATVIVHGPIVRDESGAITDVGGTWTLTLDSENKWKTTVADLPLGEYLIHESFASVHGYTWTDVAYGELETTVYNNITSGVFKVTEDATEIKLQLTNTYEVWNTADFYIYKVDESGAKLEGAEFTLYTSADDGETLTPVPRDVTNWAVTGADGYAYFTGYTAPENGTTVYYLKETKAPAGYYLSDTLYKVEIKAVTDDAGKTSFESKISVKVNGVWVEADGWDPVTDLLTVTNSPVLGQLSITKQLVGAPADVTAISVHIGSNNGYSNTVELNASNNWSVELDVPLGTYSITELNANVAGYSLKVEYKVENTVSADGAVITLAEDTHGSTTTDDKIKGAAAIVNTYSRNEEFFEVPTSLTVKKVGEDGTTALAGAVFQLDRLGSDGKVISSASFTTNSDGIVTFDMLSGFIVNGGPIDGTYRLSETKAPEGYAKTDTTWTVTVEENGVEEESGTAYRIVLNEEKNIFENFWDWIIGGITGNMNESMYSFTEANGSTPATLTVTNMELSKLTVSKNFVDGEGNALSPEITKNARVEIHVHGPITRSGNTITDIGPLVETVTLPDANGNWEITVENLDAGEYVLREPFASLHGYSWEGASYKINGKEVTLESYNGTEGFAPFEVKLEEADITVELTNKYTEWEAADFYINKVKDINALTDGLAGATFQLYTDAACAKEAEGTFTTSATTGLAGYAHFTGFDAAGTYYVKETKAPENYYSTDSVWKVVIGHDADNHTYTTDVTLEKAGSQAAKWSWNGDRDILNVENTEILGELTIRKTFGEGEDEAGNDLKPGHVKVDVKYPDGHVEEVILSETNGWTKTLTKLQMGTYTIKEKDASQAGYVLTTEYYEGEAKEVTDYAEVTLNQGDQADVYVRKASVRINNTYDKQEATVHNPASFEVKKVDKDGNVLAGAEFTLKADGMDPIVKTTDGNGVAKFEELYGNKENQSAVTYTLTETKAPAGYVKANASWTVKVQEDDGKVTVKLNKDNNLFENIWDWIVGETSGATWDEDKAVLTVVNEKTKLTIDKAFARELNGKVTTKTDGMPIEDTKFSFEVAYGDVKQTVSIDLGDNDETNNTAVVYGIPVGTKYTVTETTTGESFTSNTAEGTMGESGVAQATITNTYKFFTVGAKKVVEVEKPKNMVVNDSFFEPWYKADYTFALVVDGETVEEMTIKDGQEKQFDYILPVGTKYNVVEVEREGTIVYYKPSYSGPDNNVTTVTNTYTMVAGDLLEIEMVKADSGKKRTPLAGAKFALYNEDKDLIGYYSSAKDGSFVIDDIDEPGTYTLKEIKAPDGYNKLSKAVTIKADYAYYLETDADGSNPRIVQQLVATKVSGSMVEDLNDGSYRIKNTKITDNPKTGDQFNMKLWVGVGGAAAVALIILLILGKKKGKK